MLSLDEPGKIPAIRRSMISSPSTRQTTPNPVYERRATLSPAIAYRSPATGLAALSSTVKTANATRATSRVAAIASCAT